MFGRIFRSWPRLVAGMGLLTAFLLGAWVTGIAEQPVPAVELQSVQGFIIFAIALLIVAFGCVALPTWFFAALFPGMLGLVDLFLLTLLLGLPASMALDAIAVPGWVYCIAYGAIFLVLQQIFYGPWLARFARADTRPHSTMFEIPEPIGTVWARLAPLPDNAASYYWPNADFQAPPDGSDADFVLISPRRRGLRDSEELVWIEHLEPGRALTIRTEPRPGTFGVKERLSLRLTEVGARTRIEIETTYREVSIFHRFRLWLNNDAREFAVSLKNRALDRKDGSVHGRQVQPV